jgi:acetyl esterase/lipase
MPMSALSRRTLLASSAVAALAAACGGSSSSSKQRSTTVSGVTRSTEAYGAQPLNVGEWFVPAGAGPAPTVVLVHGGFWRQQYDRSLEEPVALDLAGRGYLCWNIDYRSSAKPWPSTLTDVAAAYDFLVHGKYADRIDRSKIAVVGHSAGGQLVAWLAGRHNLPAGVPGHNPAAHRPTLCVPQAGVVALTDAAQQNLGSGAPQALCGGGPADVADRYAIADPTRLLPTGVRSVLIHDRNDDVVPLSQSETYVHDAKQAGDDSTLAVVPGDHFSHIDPKSAAIQKLRDTLATL